MRVCESDAEKLADLCDAIIRIAHKMTEEDGEPLIAVELKNLRNVGKCARRLRKGGGLGREEAEWLLNMMDDDNTGVELILVKLLGGKLM